MPNGISKTTLVALLAAVAIVATAGSLVYQANAQSDEETDDELSAFEKNSIGGNIKYTGLDIEGSVNITEQMTNQVLSEAEVAFPEAAMIATDAVAGEKVLSGNLGVIQGFLVYTFVVVDGDNRIYTAIIDAGDGEVLYTSEPMDSMPNAVLRSVIGGPVGFSPFHAGYLGMGAVKVIPQPVEAEN
ncbi:MAG: hypothetical protein AB1351_07380 [Thermoproteota archaeon]